MTSSTPTPHPIRFGGLLIPNRGWTSTLTAARELESLGFDLVAVDDHISNPVAPQRPWAEAWTTLAALAGATSTIALSTLVSNTVLRHPVLLSRQALSVDDISNGRLEIGLGAGYAPVDLEAVALAPLPAADWQRRFAESVAVVEALVRGRRPEPGTFFDASAMQLCDPADARRIPITVAANSAASLDLAARLADRWVSYGGWGMTRRQIVDITRRRAELLAERCAAHGREGAVGVTLLLGSDAVCTEPLWTSAAGFEETVDELCSAGVDTFVLYWPPSAVSRSVNPGAVEQIVHDTIPRLRDRYG